MRAGAETVVEGAGAATDRRRDADRFPGPGLRIADRLAEVATRGEARHDRGGQAATAAVQRTHVEALGRKFMEAVVVEQQVRDRAGGADFVGDVDQNGWR